MYFIASSFAGWSSIRRPGGGEIDSSSRGYATGRSKTVPSADAPLADLPDHGGHATSDAWAQGRLGVGRVRVLDRDARHNAAYPVVWPVPRALRVLRADDHGDLRDVRSRRDRLVALVRPPFRPGRAPAG